MCCNAEEAYLCRWHMGMESEMVYNRKWDGVAATNSVTSGMPQRARRMLKKEVVASPARE